MDAGEETVPNFGISLYPNDLYTQYDESHKIKVSLFGFLHIKMKLN